MARVKVTEHSLNQLLATHHLSANNSFHANSTTTADDLTNYFGDTPLVVKVDQGIKKRGKQGLVQVDLTARLVIGAIQSWVSAGWESFIVVPFLPHEQNEEKYLSIELTRQGWKIIWGDQGGVDVETSWGQTKSSTFSLQALPQELPSFLPPATHSFVLALCNLMQKSGLVFLEANPLVVTDTSILPLDLAGLVDNTETTKLTVVHDKDTSELENNIALLDSSTPASLKCRLINPSGAIWMLLSGGGASLVLADEVADQGMGQVLGNYGEYSGAPTKEDTEKYTSFIISAMLKSQAPQKALIIAGGVANFTDVHKTFAGIITALKHHEKELQAQGVKVFVRRGGPNEELGLKLMSTYLQSSNLFGSVHGHDVVLTEVVNEVKDYLHA